MYRYAELCDDDYNPDGLAELFTDDATWSSSSSDGTIDFGHFEGRNAIRDFFGDVSKTIARPTLHCIVMPQIVVAADRKSARGRWCALGVLTERQNNEMALWGSVYTHEYLKQRETWRFSEVTSTIYFRSDVLNRDAR